jgi:hypothetical protein
MLPEGRIALFVERAAYPSPQEAAAVRPFSFMMDVEDKVLDRELKIKKGEKENMGGASSTPTFSQCGESGWFAKNLAYIGSLFLAVPAAPNDRCQGYV